MVFGVLEIIAGAFCLISIPTSLLGTVGHAKQNGSWPDLMFILPSLLMLGLMAAGLIWLGIGSIKARRWARALSLCLGWIALCAGTLSLGAIIFSLGMMDEMMRQQGQELPPAAMMIMKIGMVVFGVIFYVAMPGAVIGFYRSQNVKLTCEHRDPVVRWTDRCPLPVLALCLIDFFGAVYLLPCAITGVAFPLFGYIITGWMAQLLWLGFGSLTLYITCGLYHLKHLAWLASMGLLLLFGLSTVFTFTRRDLIELYRASGFPEWQLEQLAANPMLQSNLLMWTSAIGLIFWGGYLVYVRRYFVAGKSSTPVT